MDAVMWRTVSDSQKTLNSSDAERQIDEQGQKGGPFVLDLLEERNALAIASKRDAAALDGSVLSQLHDPTAQGPHSHTMKGPSGRHAPFPPDPPDGQGLLGASSSFSRRFSSASRVSSLTKAERFQSDTNKENRLGMPSLSSRDAAEEATLDVRCDPLFLRSAPAATSGSELSETALRREAGTEAPKRTFPFQSHRREAPFPQPPSLSSRSERKQKQHPDDDCFGVQHHHGLSASHVDGERGGLWASKRPKRLLESQRLPSCSSSSSFFPLHPESGRERERDRVPMSLQQTRSRGSLASAGSVLLQTHKEGVHMMDKGSRGGPPPPPPPPAAAAAAAKEDEEEDEDLWGLEEVVLSPSFQHTHTHMHTYANYQRPLVDLRQPSAPLHASVHPLPVVPSSNAHFPLGPPGLPLPSHSPSFSHSHAPFEERSAPPPVSIAGLGGPSGASLDSGVPASLSLPVAVSHPPPPPPLTTAFPLPIHGRSCSQRGQGGGQRQEFRLPAGAAPTGRDAQSNPHPHSQCHPPSVQRRAPPPPLPHTHATPHSDPKEPRTQTTVRGSTETEKEPLAPPPRRLQGETTAISSSLLFKRLTTEQQQVVDADPCSRLMVVAGPGSGKTTATTARIVRMFREGCRPIAALTFSKKAAEELKTRVAQELAVASSSSSSSLSASLRGFGLGGVDGVAGGGGSGRSAVDRIEALTHTMRRGIGAGPAPSELFVGTLHSFCRNLLKRHGEAIGISSNFEVGTPSKCRAVLKQAIAKVQQHATDSSAKWGAGGRAGGGGGRGGGSVQPNQTSTSSGRADQAEAAADDLEEEFLTENEADDEKDQTHRGGASGTGGDDRQVKALMGMIQRAKRDEGYLQRLRQEQPEIARLYDLYTSACMRRKKQLIDFSDLLLYTRKLLLTSEAVRGAVQRSWPFLFCDEFQDTSREQLDILLALAGAQLEGTRRGNENAEGGRNGWTSLAMDGLGRRREETPLRRTGGITVVGDDDQAIYGWRGSDVAVFRLFLQAFSSPSHPVPSLTKRPCQSSSGRSNDYSAEGFREEGVTQLHLNCNWRSVGAIVECASRLVRHNERGVHSQPQSTGGGAGGGNRMSMVPMGRIPKKLFTLNEMGRKPAVRCLPDASREASFLGEEILRLRRERGLGWGEFGVIARTNAVLRFLKARLESGLIGGERIPTSLSSAAARKEMLKAKGKGGGSSGVDLFKRPEVLDVLAYVRLVLDPCHCGSFVRVFNKPKRGLSFAFIRQLESRGAKVTQAKRTASPLDGSSVLPSKILQDLSTSAFALNCLPLPLPLPLSRHQEGSEQEKVQPACPFALPFQTASWRLKEASEEEKRKAAPSRSPLSYTNTFQSDRLAAPSSYLSVLCGWLEASAEENSNTLRPTGDATTCLKASEFVEVIGRLQRKLQQPMGAKEALSLVIRETVAPSFLLSLSLSCTSDPGFAPSSSSCAADGDGDGQREREQQQQGGTVRWEEYKKSEEEFSSLRALCWAAEDYRAASASAATGCVSASAYHGTHSASGLFCLASFLADLEGGLSSLSAGGAQRAKQSVALSTVHQAKGLEWPVVFVVRLNEGTLPSLRPMCTQTHTQSRQQKGAQSGGAQTDTLSESVLRPPPHASYGPGSSSLNLNSNSGDWSNTERERQQNGEEAIAEERRNAYVALTRAKEVLVLSYISRGASGEQEQPSRFLFEAGLLGNENL
uniref:DNA 3'-5' helicase n=1 Tax=Chromera velia CCMP2878 TaxID=1169474 RepID=A0A0G4FRI8_9ALVE|eukprot:Cvel_18398.t1-p1 / transcript=Cvel_18398.t1 / gene=Cvel_18398 / organism=Chromera_velia_CCMP2878 / gene_product=DNA helicase II, putative / transcript_product=DNA helicase II, putative / location=Cvel_scaffold1521:6353-22216(-) / protein_length=1695 / sequence_SO=supercontig / SO=protein_coding / is_pseudo=false